jgi:hypothetical protein
MIRTQKEATDDSCINSEVLRAVLCRPEHAQHNKWSDADVLSAGPEEPLRGCTVYVRRNPELGQLPQGAESCCDELRPAKLLGLRLVHTG